MKSIQSSRRYHQQIQTVLTITDDPMALLGLVEVGIPLKNLAEAALGLMNRRDYFHLLGSLMARHSLDPYWDALEAADGPSPETLLLHTNTWEEVHTLQAAIRQMPGREGFAVLARPSSGGPFQTGLPASGEIYPKNSKLPALGLRFGSRKPVVWEAGRKAVLDLVDTDVSDWEIHRLLGRELRLWDCSGCLRLPEQNSDDFQLALSMSPDLDLQAVDAGHWFRAPYGDPSVTRTWENDLQVSYVPALECTGWEAGRVTTHQVNPNHPLVLSNIQDAEQIRLLPPTPYLDLRGHIECLPDGWRPHGSLSIQSEVLRSLPEGLCIDGNLDLERAWDLEALPENLQVLGGLEISQNAALKTLPKTLKVGADLKLIDLELFETLGPLRTIWGRVLLENLPNLKALPQGFQVRQGLFLTGLPQLEGMPEGWQVGGGLHLEECHGITEVRLGKWLKGDLSICDCNGLEKLPSKWSVSGDLRLSQCPRLWDAGETLMVDGSLSLHDLKNLSSLPANLAVKHLWIKGCPILRTLPENLILLDPEATLVTSGMRKDVASALMKQWKSAQVMALENASIEFE